MKQDTANATYNTYADLIREAELPAFPQESAEGVRPLTMLSLFSGCGGMDLGFEGGFICHQQSVGAHSPWIERPINDQWVLLKRNRFRTVFANDILKEAFVAWRNYMARFHYAPSIYHQESIVDLVKAHQQGAKVFPEEVDIVTGGFPCQDFSVAGKRMGFKSDKAHDGKKRDEEIPTEESRGKLYYWMKQVIDITKPKIFIAENVKGLVSLGDVRHIIQQDFAQAADDGYIVLPPQVLHAGNYGVPETRERVIFIGIRRNALTAEARANLEQEIIPAAYNPYPAPTHHFTPETDATLLPPVTCRAIFEGLKEPEKSLDLSQRRYSKARYLGAHWQGQIEIHLDGLAPTIRSEHHGNIEYRRLSKEHGGLLEEELAKGWVERRLTPRECALIQTFPPDYPFVAYKADCKRFQLNPSGAYRVIGNAVPPLLAYNIARRIQELWACYFECK